MFKKIIMSLAKLSQCDNFITDVSQPFRHLAKRIGIVLLSFILSACASTPSHIDNSLNEELDDEVSLSDLAQDKVVKQADPFADFLSDYLRLNLLDRTDISRRLINRSNLELEGRLPSKALYRSLGYRLRESFVSLPPELEVRPYASREDIFQSELIEDLELTWAMLDSTLFRLNTSSVKQKAGHDWVNAVTRRNLLQEASNYWFQAARQDNYLTWLNTLSEQTQALFEDIAKARKNYDVQDLRDQELALLDLRADSASLFQFYSSEQARLYNRTESRVLPEQAASQRNYFQNMSVCAASSNTFSQGQSYLNSQHNSSMSLFNLEPSAINDKKISYEFNLLARQLSGQALRLYAQRNKASLARHEKMIERAEHQKQMNIKQLIADTRLREERGEEIDPQAIDAARAAAVTVPYKSISVSYKERQFTAAISTLADLVAQKLLSVSQQRLTRVLNQRDTLFTATKTDTWSRSTPEAQAIREILLDIYDNSLIELLLGYERAAFTNLLMHRNCLINNNVNSHTMATPRRVIDGIATVSRHYHINDLPIVSLGARYGEYKRLEDAMASSDITSQYRAKPVLSINEESSNSKPQAQPPSLNKPIPFSDAKERLSRYGLSLATRSEILKNVADYGFTLQLVTAAEESEIARIINKLGLDQQTIIYRSQRSSSKEYVYKLLVGFSDNYDDINRLKNKFKRGWIKPYDLVRSDILD